MGAGISVSAVFGIIVAVFVVYFLIQLAVRWLKRLGIEVDGLLVYTLYVVLAIVAVLFLASAFGIPVPLVHW